VLGGVDATGPHLFTVHPHGSTDKLPYVTMGSGSLAAMAVFESGWKANMEVSLYVIYALTTFLIIFLARRGLVSGESCYISRNIQ
jgi:20S proteasome alpha/beta subunit